MGMRIRGLWGSMWSRAKTGALEAEFRVDLSERGFYVLANLLFFVPRRDVTGLLSRTLPDDAVRYAAEDGSRSIVSWRVFIMLRVEQPLF